MWNHQNLGAEAAPLAEEVDAVTLCNRLLSVLGKLPPQDRTRAIRLCVQVVSRKGARWREKHLESLKKLALRIKRSDNDNEVRTALDDVTSEVIRARARRAKGKDGQPPEATAA